MPTDIPDKNLPNESRVSNKVSDAVEQTKSKLADFGTAAAGKIEQNRAAAASGIEGAAATLHQRADHLPGGEKVTNFAHSAADRLNATAGYVRQNDLNNMRNDIEDLVKKNPGPSLLAAVALGFFIGRSLKGNSRE